MSKRTFILWLLIFCLALAPFGCDQARSNFDQITLGMSRPEVEKLLGQPARVEDNSGKPVAYWTYGGQQLIVQFHQDKVQVKQLAPVKTH